MARRAAVVHAGHRELRRLRAAAVLDPADQLRRYHGAARAHRQQPVAARARLPAPRAGLAAARAHGVGARAWWRSRRSSASTSSPSSSSIAASTTGSTSTSSKGSATRSSSGRRCSTSRRAAGSTRCNDFALQLADVGERRSRGDAQRAAQRAAMRSSSRSTARTEILGVASVDLEPGSAALSDGRGDAAAAPARAVRQRRAAARRRISDPRRRCVHAAAARTTSSASCRRSFRWSSGSSTLANAVQGSYNQVKELTYLRTALKYSFTLTLSLVLLISLLASVYGAFFFSRRLVTPIQLLMQGTRAVARGDFATRVPTPARDEIGFLVHSFNDMTQRLAQRQRGRAPEPAAGRARAAQARGDPRAPVDGRRVARAGSADPDGESRRERDSRRQSRDARRRIDRRSSRESEPLLAQFVGVAQAHLQRGDREWREQIMMRARRRPARADVRVHGAAGRDRQPERLRDRVRRHHGAPASAARRGVGRSRAPPRARDQESAHADPALRRAAAPQVSEARVAAKASCSTERRTPSFSRSRP